MPTAAHQHHHLLDAKAGLSLEKRRHKNDTSHKSRNSRIMSDLWTSQTRNKFVGLHLGVQIARLWTIHHFLFQKSSRVHVVARKHDDLPLPRELFDES